MRFTLDRSFYLKDTDQVVPSPLDQAQAVAYLRQSGERWVYLCFRGKAAKPVYHYSTRSREAAEKAIAEFYQEEARRAQFKVERHQQRKADKEKAKAEFLGKPGSVFVQSWGWEQTNVNAFQMVRRLSPSAIEAVEIGLAIDGEAWTGPMADHVIPCPVSQDLAEASENKIVMKVSSVDAVQVPGTKGYEWGRSAILWDEKRNYYRSWYA